MKPSKSSRPGSSTTSRGPAPYVISMYRAIAHMLLSVGCGVHVVMDLTGGWGLFNVQENLKRLRDSITRRHKERQKPGEELGW